MGNILFIISLLVIIAPVVKSFTSQGECNYGIYLSKNWLIGIIVAEFILLILAWLDYLNHIDPNIANDFFWHNLFVYHRGILPASPLISLLDSVLPATVLSVIVFITALIVDYGVLRAVSLIRNMVKGRID